MAIDITVSPFSAEQLEDVPPVSFVRFVLPPQSKRHGAKVSHRWAIRLVGCGETCFQPIPNLRCLVGTLHFLEKLSSQYYHFRSFAARDQRIDVSTCVNVAIQG